MVAKSVASRKGKSRKLQNLVSKKLQDIFDTDSNDIKYQSRNSHQVEVVDLTQN